MTDDNDLPIQYVTETVWELTRRVRQGIACELDIDALRAIEFAGRTPLLRMKASEALDCALLNGWLDYILEAETREQEQCGSNF